MYSAGSTAGEERMTRGGSAQEDIALLLPEMLWLEPRSKQGVMRKLRQGVQHEFSRLESERPELRLSSGETLAGEWQRVPGTLMCFTTAPNASDSHVGNARYKLVMSHISPR